VFAHPTATGLRFVVRSFEGLSRQFLAAASRYGRDRAGLDKGVGEVKLKMNLVDGAMNATINAKQLRASLPKVVERVRKGARFTVLYRSRPAFRIVPVEETPTPEGELEDEPLYRAMAVGRSSDGGAAAEHDAVLYGG